MLEKIIGYQEHFSRIVLSIFTRKSSRSSLSVKKEIAWSLNWKAAGDEDEDKSNLVIYLFSTLATPRWQEMSCVELTWEG
ncbi:hypothetical protein SLEP1_g18280 [Rubroshorea leprosula]|uniref:Uncharacterized protein n=1 Tax=Rubroshorea leprosula TaxID=152421 RepID=A0AAV5J2G8_9ROSI|nr:hypothetical protein SLEP1_g18280 [Rubroshorea leprosula]